jgi:hypothetical protein
MLNNQKNPGEREGAVTDKGRERRINPRTPVELDAVLNYDSRAVICTVRDISVSGAFLETDTSELPFKESVELSVNLPTEKGMRSHRVPILIRRRSDNGAGVAFGELDKDAYYNLLEFVFHA